LKEFDLRNIIQEIIGVKYKLKQVWQLSKNDTDFSKNCPHIFKVLQEKPGIWVFQIFTLL
jgi:hypothetical protein